MIREELFELTLPFADKGNKTVRVYVPEHREDELLPVVYMTDGQNLFEDDRPHQFGCWYTREAVKAEQQNSGKAAIIVGIHNDESPMQRARELTPKGIGPIRYPDDMPEEVRKLMIPEGEVFDDFVLSIVMPAIERLFPVRTGRENTAFCGSSSGGLQSFFTVMSHPEKFCMAGVFSPAFTIYHTEDIIAWTKVHTQINAPFLFIFSGSADELEKEIYDSTKRAVEAIAQFYPQEKLQVTIRTDQRHHESAWAEGFQSFLHRFLFQRDILN